MDKKNSLTRQKRKKLTFERLMIFYAFFFLAVKISWIRMQERIMAPPAMHMGPGISWAKIITQTGFMSGSIIVMIPALSAETFPIPRE